ncbi:MAG: hypothetical protein PHE27_09230, partial [Alphaproteobacteria bacterium]|nr:hypothetical protein [Alphaproteobacteria bacterium]
MKKAPRSQRQANLPETCIPRSEAPYAPQPADREPSTPAVKTERFPYVLGYNDIGMKIDGHGIFLGEW